MLGWSPDPIIPIVHLQYRPDACPAWFNSAGLVAIRPSAGPVRRLTGQGWLPFLKKDRDGHSGEQRSPQAHAVLVEPRAKTAVPEARSYQAAVEAVEAGPA